jgi:hypothetical protein
VVEAFDGDEELAAVEETVDCYFCYVFIIVNSLNNKNN